VAIIHAARRAMYAPDPSWDTGTRVTAIFLGLCTAKDYTIRMGSVASLARYFGLAETNIHKRLRKISAAGWIGTERRGPRVSTRRWLIKANDEIGAPLGLFFNREVVVQVMEMNGFMALDASVQLVALVVAAHVNRDEGVAWPGKESIATIAALHVKTVQRAIATLEAGGFMTSEPRMNPYTKLQTSNAYRFSDPTVVPEDKLESSEYGIALEYVARCYERRGEPIRGGFARTYSTRMRRWWDQNGDDAPTVPEYHMMMDRYFTNRDRWPGDMLDPDNRWDLLDEVRGESLAQC
jgi:hypothetical protein